MPAIIVPDIGTDELVLTLDGPHLTEGEAPAPKDFRLTGIPVLEAFLENNLTEITQAFCEAMSTFGAGVPLAAKTQTPDTLDDDDTVPDGTDLTNPLPSRGDSLEVAPELDTRARQPPHAIAKSWPAPLATTQTPETVSFGPELPAPGPTLGHTAPTPPIPGGPSQELPPPVLATGPLDDVHHAVTLGLTGRAAIFLRVLATRRTWPSCEVAALAEGLGVSPPSGLFQQINPLLEELGVREIHAAHNITWLPLELCSLLNN